MKKQNKANILNAVPVIACLGLILACNNIKDLPKSKESSNQNSEVIVNAKPKHTPNPAPGSTPSRAFEKFERIDTDKFYSTQQFTVLNTYSHPGIVDAIHYNYVYADGRYSAFHSYNTDVSLEIFKFPSADKAQQYLKELVAKSIPIADAAKVKLSKCVGEKRDNDEFIGPDKLVKKMIHPNGGEIIVYQGGDYNMVDCTRGNGNQEYVVWTDGEFYFEVVALPEANAPNNSPARKGEGRAEELAIDYLAALGQPVARTN
jgi:hypothetical protein